MRRVALVAIVKNEIAVLPRLFDSVKHIIDRAVIVDTGSTDGTQDWLRKEAPVPVEVFEYPWENMGVNRTQALEAAHETADWLLLLDADMTVEGDLPDDLEGPEAWLLRIPQPTMEFWVDRLISGHRKWVFKGAAHEYLATADGLPYRRQKLPGLTVIHHADGSNRKVKWDRSTKALEEAEPTPRNIFYLAQNYRDMGQIQKSVETYRRRVNMGGWDEEVFMAQLQVGVLTGDPEELWKAHLLRPGRREPLVQLGKLAERVPPSNDLLFVDNRVPQPVLWERRGYGTMLPPLVNAIIDTSGPVLEMGAGDWSTPMLHQLCYDRLLVTVEPSFWWRTRFAPLASTTHLFVESLSADLLARQWGVALIDHSFSDRARDMARLHADVFVVHDTNPEVIGDYPGLEEALSRFRYREDFTELTPWTTIVSNIIDFGEMA